MTTRTKGTLGEILFQCQQDSVVDAVIADDDVPASVVSQVRHDVLVSSRGANTSQADVSRDADLVRNFEERKKRLREEIRENNDNHTAMIHSIKTLRSTYLHGLERIANLQDLRDAPDAYMPPTIQPQSSKD
jgi:hypothetical protein